MGELPFSLRAHPLARESTRGRLPSATVALAVINGFVGLTAAAGAVFVVPTLPTDMYRFDGFSGDFVPSIGLGLTAAISIAALYGLLSRRRFGAPLSIVAGATLVIFELVEAFAVGDLFTPPVGMSAAGDAALWLQPFYIAVGLAMILIGGRPPATVNLHSKAVAIALVAMTLGAASLSGWAQASTGTSMYARLIAWGSSTTYDWARFPSRPLPAAASPDYFVQAPLPIDLTNATGGVNPREFFASSETTALLVLQHDKLVVERYYNNADRSTMITSWSDTKSWDSAMVGAAISAGYIQSVDDPVTAYIPELARKDPRFASITLRDLLEMRSGLDWNTSGLLDTDDSVVGNSTALREAVLDRVRIVAAPGTVFRYNDFNPLLMGIVIERASGRTVTQWLDQTLWAPLGAQYPGSFSIDSVTGGFEKMEGGLNGRPIDLIRIGQLYLQDGAWDEAQIIPSQWVGQTTDYATALPSRFQGVRYAMGWWTRVIDGTQVLYAWGNHGEYVLVAPSLDIVVARFGRQYGFGAPRGDSSGGNVGVQTWPQVLTRIATTVAATVP